MTEQSFRTCRFAQGCFDPCCDAPCPKHGNPDDRCGVSQGSDECFAIVCPTCKSFQERDNVEKYTDENILLEAKTTTDELLSEFTPGHLGRPLCAILVGDDGYCIQYSPAFDGDDDNLIYGVKMVLEDLEKPRKRQEIIKSFLE
jgi:hypothetical protein